MVTGGGSEPLSSGNQGSSPRGTRNLFIFNCVMIILSQFTLLNMLTKLNKSGSVCVELIRVYTEKKAILRKVHIPLQ